MIRFISISLAALNIIIGIVYTQNIVQYLDNKYNYDGFRYVVYVLAFDAGFLVLYLLAQNNKEWRLAYWILGIAAIHTINMGVGIAIIPFAGLAISIVAILLVLFQVKPFEWIDISRK